ncbi:hypothetical protein D8666_19695 [Ochrobactrum soli]|uniref:hypothetical protein n=1 Tax=Ochrobactrum soli TaxID=2448455 RepID=UPI000EF1EA9F|nr:hypothetical protein [[Ochrobactrum] soli]RLL71690.1 hypothetical protein D8666_19695 [[Ochrobactrum] soli]
MKKIAWAAGVLFAVWLTAFIWIKWSDLGCSQDWTVCAHETGIWFRKLVLLEWASKWQALIAGIGALLGGAFVIIAANRTADLARFTEQETRKRQATIACSLISDEFRDAAYQIAHYAPDRARSYFPSTSTYLPALSQINPMLSSIVSSTKRDALLHIEDSLAKSVSGGVSPSVRHMEAAKCYVIWRILSHISENLTDTGTYDLFKEGSIPANELLFMLKGLAVRPQSITGLSGFFDWSK